MSDASWERYEAILKEATCSEEMCAKVLKKVAGGYKYALIEYLESVLGADDEEYIDDVSEALENAVDAILSEAVEKEILGVIPKEV